MKVRRTGYYYLKIFTFSDVDVLDNHMKIRKKLHFHTILFFPFFLGFCLKSIDGNHNKPKSINEGSNKLTRGF